MISFSCSSCGKKLKVNDGLAGKAGRCPHCRQEVRVPALAAGSPAPGEGARAPAGENFPTDVQDMATVLPGAAAREDGEGADTLGGKAPVHPLEDNELTNFLAPAQGPGEIGWLGPYRILKVLGAGGMGVVYKAEDPHLQRPVALKAMLPGLGASAAARQRFLREARAAAAVKHDHIVTIYQVGEDRGVPFLAMEFLEGQPLDDRLKKEPRLPVAEVLRIGRETAEGLQAAHERGLIHRDIKPANLWLEGPRQRVKILDFGLARPASGQEQLTQTGAILGTPAYMAPEQARGEKVDSRCDLFSLGCVLYRLCAGELPFKGSDTISTLMAVTMETPQDLESLNPEVPPGLVALVNRLLEKRRDDRPASAGEVAAELEAIQRAQTAEGPTVVQPPPPVPRRRREKAPASRVPWVVAGIAAAVLLLGGVAAALLVGGKGDGETKVAGGKGKAKSGKKQAKVVPEAPPEPAAPPEPPAPPARATPAQASDFFNGKDLTGWEGLPELWSVKGGALVGATKPLKFNTFLCSKKTYRDFELTCQVRLTGDKANSGIQVRSRVIDRANFVVAGPQADMGEGFWGGLYGEKSGGMMKAAPKEVQAAIKKNDFNDFFLRVSGKHVTIKVNGRTTVDDDFPTMPDEGIIAFQLHAGLAMEAAFRNIRFRDLSGEEKGWVQLFNGKDLTGWKVQPGKNREDWRVEGGALVSRGKGGYLFSDRGDYRDFHIRVEVMINFLGNSGLFFRCPFGDSVRQGYEAQIAARGGDAQLTGSLYGIVPVREEHHKTDEWFTEEVIVRGDHIVIKVNGTTTVDTHNGKRTEGHFALQQNSPATVVKLRKIEVKELRGE
jgi:hypothetical protein